jgi:hypothetical protein
VTWRGAGGDTAGDIAVLDLGPRGLWRPGPGQGGELTWSPVDAGAVWQVLSALFATALNDHPAA